MSDKANEALPTTEDLAKENKALKTQLQTLQLPYAVLRELAELNMPLHDLNDIARLVQKDFHLEDGHLRHRLGYSAKQVVDRFIEDRPHYHRDFDSSLDDAERARLTRIFGNGATGKLANDLAKESIHAYRKARERAIELNIIPNVIQQRPAKARSN